MNSFPCEISDHQLIAYIKKELSSLGVYISTDETDNLKENEIIYKSITELHEHVRKLKDKIDQQDEQIKVLNSIIETKNMNNIKFNSEKESLIKLNETLIEREQVLLKEINNKNNAISAQANLIREAMDKKILKKTPLNISSPLPAKIKINEDPKVLLFKQSIDDQINRVNILEKEKNEIIKFLTFIKNELDDIISNVAPNKKCKEYTDIIIENKLQRDIRKGIVILKQWCIEQYLKTENVKEYVSNMANIVDRYKNLNSGFNQIFKEILKIPEDKMNAILYDPSKIDEQIMKNIEYDGKELISNISLRTVNYYSNRDFYTKIKEDIRKTTIILNEYKNFINNHQF